MHPTKRVNKDEELTCLSINFELQWSIVSAMPFENSAKTLSIMTHSIRTLSTITPSMMTLTIMTLRYNDTEDNDT